jgi:hypothetical protein
MGRPRGDEQGSVSNTAPNAALCVVLARRTAKTFFDSSVTTRDILVGCAADTFLLESCRAGCITPAQRHAPYSSTT